jgi:restriction system protein
MPIPDYQTVMLPLLKLTSDKQEHKISDLVETLAVQFRLTDNERKELLPSGQTFIFGSRVGWARTYLKKARLLDSEKRATVTITERGLSVLKQNPLKIDVKLLRQFPEFLEFQNTKKDDADAVITPVDLNNMLTPEETLEGAYQSIRKSLAQELRKKIIEQPPAFFEKLVVELLVKMGYGGSLKDAGKATRLTNDEGIDGIIKEDKLGLDFIYIQAKRWDNQTVGRPDIQSFVGALDGQRATKGIFITTSRFAENAKEYVKTITKKVILIDGDQLAEFMIDYGLGVSTSTTYDVKKIDSDYFGE